MPHVGDAAKKGSNKGSPRIVEHVQSKIVKDGDKDVTFKCSIKGNIAKNSLCITH